MKGSNDYTKLFGSPKNSSYYGDVKVSKNTDIFGFDKDQKKKKKKKKKKSRIDNIVKTAVGYDETDELLNRFICFEKEDHDLETLEDLSQCAKGLFIIKVYLNEGQSGYLTIFVTNDNKVLEVNTGKEVIDIFIEMATQGTEISETDLEVYHDKFKKAKIIEDIFNIETGKIIDLIRDLEE